MSEHLCTKATQLWVHLTHIKKPQKHSDCHALILLKLAHLSELKFTANQVMRIRFLGKSSGLLLQERHRHNCECLWVEVVSVVRLHVDDEILLWWLARLQDIYLHVSVCVFDASARYFEAELICQQNHIVN